MWESVPGGLRTQRYFLLTASDSPMPFTHRSFLSAHSGSLNSRLAPGWDTVSRAMPHSRSFRNKFGPHKVQTFRGLIEGTACVTRGGVPKMVGDHSLEVGCTFSSPGSWILLPKQEERCGKRRQFQQRWELQMQKQTITDIFLTSSFGNLS